MVPVWFEQICVAALATVRRVAETNDDRRLERLTGREHIAFFDHETRGAGGAGRAGQRLEQAHARDNAWRGGFAHEVENRQRIGAAAGARIDDQHALVGKASGASEAVAQHVVDESNLGADEFGGRVVHASAST